MLNRVKRRKIHDNYIVLMLPMLGKASNGSIVHNISLQQPTLTKYILTQMIVPSITDFDICRLSLFLVRCRPTSKRGLQNKIFDIIASYHKRSDNILRTMCVESTKYYVTRYKKQNCFQQVFNMQKRQNGKYCVI